MDPPKFKKGDLVFAKCTKSKPWPGKIIEIFEDTTFKVDFYNHNSLGIVDLKDLQRVTFATIQKYNKLYQQRKNKDEYLLIEGIKAIQKDFKRRLEIENKEVQKWKNGLPTRAQEQKLQAKLEVEIKKKILKPSQAKLEQIKQQLSSTKSKGKPASKSLKELNREETREPEESAQPPSARPFLRKRKQLVVVLKPSPQAEKEKKANKKGKRDKQTKKVQEVSIKKQGKAPQKVKKIKKGLKKKKDKKKKSSRKKELSQEREEQKQDIKQLPTQKNLSLLSPIISNQNQRAHSMQAEEQVTPTEQLHTDQEQGGVSPISNRPQQDCPLSAPMVTCSRQQQQSAHSSETSTENAGEGQILQQYRQHPQNPSQLAESSRDVPDISISTSLALNSTHENIKTSEVIAMIDEKQDLQGGKQRDSSEGKEYVQAQQLQKMAQEIKQPREVQNPQEQLEQGPQQQINHVSQSDCSATRKEELLPPQENDKASENSDLSLHSSEMKDVINQFDSYVSQPELPASETPVSKTLAIPQPKELMNSQFIDSIQQIEANTQISTDKASPNRCQSQLQSPPMISLKPQNEPDVMISDLQIQHSQKKQEQSEIVEQRQIGVHPEFILTNAPINKQQAKCPQEMISEHQDEASNSQQPSLLSEEVKLLSSLQPTKEVSNEREPFNPVKVLMQYTSEDRMQRQKEQGIQKIRQQNNRLAVQTEKQSKTQSEMKPEETQEVHEQFSTVEVPNVPNEDQDPVQFQKRYADYSLTKNDYCDMVRGLPLLKQQLKAANHKAMARSLVIYLQKLKTLISAPASNYSHHLLQMWRKQLLMGILDSDILPLQMLIEQCCIDKMLIFITAFQKSKEAHRSQCHVEYMLSMNRLDLYIYRFRKGLRDLRVSDYQKGRYAQLFELFQERKFNLD